MDGGVVKAYELCVAIRMTIDHCNRKLETKTTDKWIESFDKIPGPMMSHYSFASVLLRLAQDDIHFGCEQASQLNDSTETIKPFPF